jgi:hypothetical protein
MICPADRSCLSSVSLYTSNCASTVHIHTCSDYVRSRHPSSSLSAHSMLVDFWIVARSPSRLGRNRWLGRLAQGHRKRSSSCYGNRSNKLKSRPSSSGGGDYGRRMRYVFVRRGRSDWGTCGGAAEVGRGCVNDMRITGSTAGGQTLE